MDTKEQKSNCDDIYLGSASLFLPQNINLIEKEDGKNQWSTIYDVINGLYFKEGRMFSKYFIQHFKINANISHSIPSKTKKKMLLRENCIHWL